MRLTDVGRSGSVEQALRRAAAARRRVREDVELVVSHTRIVGATATVLGRHQTGAEPAALRRETGGPPWVLAEGAHWIRVALAHASVLMPTPPDKLLNRNVRPLLAAIRRSGPVAMYGGRDFVSADGTIVALVAWARGAGGEVVLDVALASPDGTLLDPRPSPGTPWYVGKTACAVVDPELPARIAAAYAPEAERVEIDEAPLPPPPWSVTVPATLTRPVEIGSASAVLERAGRRIARAGVAGDFFADDALEGLGEVLAGALDRRDAAALAEVLGRVVIEGVREPARTLSALLLASP